MTFLNLFDQIKDKVIKVIASISRNGFMKNYPLAYALYAALFGILFPLVATIIHSHEHQCGFFEAQIRYPSLLLFIIDSAPLVLASVSYFIGIHHHKLIKEISRQNRLSEAREEEAKSALSDLKNFQKALDEYAMVAITDQNGSFTYVNNLFCKKSGYERNELLGKNANILSSHYHTRDFWEHLWKVLLSGQKFHGEIKNKNKNGVDFWVKVTIIPLDSSQNHHKYNEAHFLTIQTDITLQRYQDAKNQQMAKMSSLGEMAAGIAHEINNPLAVINGYCSKMKKTLTQMPKDQTPHQDFLESFALMTDKILTSSNIMSKIIRGLKTISRDGQGDPFELTPVKNILEDTLVLTRQKIEKIGIQFHPPIIDENLQIQCRSVHIVQTLVNLLNNAQDAVIDLEDKWIKLEVTETENEVEFSVIDSGKGLSKEIAKRIMEPFYTTKPVGKGTGLGLSLSRELIKAHNGTLAFDNQSPNTRFVVIIPKLHEEMIKNVA